MKYCLVLLLYISVISSMVCESTKNIKSDTNTDSETNSKQKVENVVESVDEQSIESDLLNVVPASDLNKDKQHRKGLSVKIYVN